MFCYLCNTNLYNQLTFPLFRNQNENSGEAANIPDTPTPLESSKILETVLSIKLDPAKIHSKVVCNKCQLLIKRYHYIEQKYIKVRNELLIKYQNTSVFNNCDFKDDNIFDFTLIDTITDDSISNMPFLTTSQNLYVLSFDNVESNNGNNTYDNSEKYLVTSDDYTAPLIDDGSFLLSNDAANGGTMSLAEAIAEFIDNDVQNFDIFAPEFLNQNENEFKTNNEDPDTTDEIIDVVGDPSVDESVIVNDEKIPEVAIPKALATVPKKRFRCQVCGKRFAYEALLKRHEKAHIAEISRMCDVCGKTFGNRSNLSAHKRAIHLNDKRYKCYSCDYSSTRKWQLESHMRSHFGERPFACDICYATFTNPEKFRKHFNAHSNIRYYCNICDKKFNNPNHRNAHRYAHTDKKRYECSTCGLGFSRKSLLKEHMQHMAHLDKKP